MEHFIIYLIKASGLLAVFYVAYYTLLRKETFFNTNRQFLLAGLITSAIFPLLVLTRTVWIEAAPQAEMQKIDMGQLIMMQQQMAANEVEPVNWYNILGGIYIAGMLFFLARFIIDIQSILKMLEGKTVIYKNGFKYIDSEAIQSPFSFFNYIVYNSKTLTPQELQNILSHEKVHSSQKHSLDMLFSQLFCIMLWFNPFAWMYKKAISQNLEFIADAEAAKQIENIKEYQKTLLKITVQPECTAIINHFYQSLIKKRIVMLNKKQSKTRNSWKYAVVMPALIAFMFCFQLKVIAQEKTTKIETSEHTSVKVALEVTKDSKNEELEAEKDFFKQEFDTDVTFSDITRNENGEITGIKIVAKSPSETSVYESSGETAITPFTIEVEKDDNGNQKISFGITPSIKATGNVSLHQSKDNTISYTTDKEIIISDSPAPKSPARASVISKSSSPAPVQEGNWSVNNIAIDNKDLLIVINGVKQEKGESIKLPLNMEIDKMNFLDKKDGRKKYGKDGKKGAVEITTKKVSAHFPASHKILQSSDTIWVEKRAVQNILNNQMMNMNMDAIAFSSEQMEEFKKLHKLSEEDLKNMQESMKSLQITMEESDDIQRILINSREEMEAARKRMEELRTERMDARKAELDARKQHRDAERMKAKEARERETEERKRQE